MWWQPKHFQTKKKNLMLRADLMKSIRRYFEQREFVEVDTPCLQISPGMEAHLKAFETEFNDHSGCQKEKLYLHTSPEFAMKKLLVAGMDNIFQICKAFRNSESATLHACEFTMLEWYETNTTYEDFMEHVQEFIRHCAKELDLQYFHYKEAQCDPFSVWEKITVCEAFHKYADIDLESCMNHIRRLRAQADRIGVVTSREDRWDDIFFKVFLDRIEPELGQGRPTILFDYPIDMAALSRPKQDDPRFAERFEVYICAMELANAFGELRDPDIQKQRFEKEMALKKELYGNSWPIDEEFLQALEQGLPPSCGISLGVDRLIMLISGAENIDEVLWCGKPGAPYKH